MALASIPIPPDPKRDAKARELLATIHTWNTVTLKQDWNAFKKGDQALQTPNGYRVNAVWCECPDYATWGNICKHVRAVCLKDAQQTTKPRPTYDALYPPCAQPGCGADPESGEKFCRDHWLGEFY